jgi:hypothetical protein
MIVIFIPYIKPRNEPEQEGSARDKISETEAVPTVDALPCICTHLTAKPNFYEPYNDFPGTTFM